MTTHRRDAPTAWQERFFGGSEQAEAEAIERWTREIQQIQYRLRAKHHAPALRRAFHAKQQAGVDNAVFVVDDYLPDDLATALFRPGARYPATVRLSNASGVVQADQEGDLRGLAARLHVSDDTVVDLLATNGAVSFARDAEQFMQFARATTGSRLLLVPRLLSAVGVRETVRMLRTAVGDTRRPVLSLATEQYWSRGGYRHGDHAVRFTFVPMADAAPPPDDRDPDYLRREIVARLRTEPVSWNLMVQPFHDERTTPIEDAAVRWNTPHVIVGRLTIPAQDLTAPDRAAVEQAVDLLDFNPWSTVPEHRPLGNINRARRLVYGASQDLRRVR